MKKMLVLGSDYFTNQVVIEAKKLGVYVIVSDLMESSPSKEIADEQWMISTKDIDVLEQKCRENEISAIMYGASDFNTENGRILCKRLGLPLFCKDDYAWSVSRDKGEFKRVCNSIGAPVARDYYITDINDENAFNNIAFPVVVKPVDKSGNRGMSYCYTVEELRKAIDYAKEVSDKKEIVIERMLKGTEHHVCYILANGEVRMSCYVEAHHQKGQLANIYSFEMNTKRFLKQYFEEVNEKLKNVFKKIGCTDGVVWVDSMRDAQDGKFYLLEMGYRFPASLASCPINEKVSGINPIKWMVEYALGIEHKKNEMPKELDLSFKGKTALIHLFTKQSGMIKRIIGLETICKMDDVFVDMPKREGSHVRASSCIGLISVYDKTCEGLCDTIKKINETIRIEDEFGNNMIVLFDDYDSIYEKSDLF